MKSINFTKFNWQGNKIIVLITQLRDCLISTVSLEYLGASQRWIRGGVRGKEKARRKDAFRENGEIKTFYFTQRSVSPSLI